MNKNFEANCRHCLGGVQVIDPLFSGKNFWVVCDFHPLVHGHILIIPKEHISCFGSLSEKKFSEFENLYEKVKNFINDNYGPVAVFEHGIVGQTVFHAHMHFLPFSRKIEDVIESNFIRKINFLDQIKEEFKKQGKYLFVEIANEKYFVNVELGYPRFFREKFAIALNAGERADWKAASKNEKLMGIFKNDVADLREKWKQKK